MFEVVRHISDVSRFCDASLQEAGALVALRRRVVEFEHLEPVARLEPVGESVEPRAQHQDLANAGLDRAPSGVLGEAAAHGDEKAQAPALRLRLGQRDRLLGVAPENGRRQRIGENDPALQRLMRRPLSRRAQRRAARLSMLHG